jgi:acyl carrier protein
VHNRRDAGLPSSYVRPRNRYETLIAEAWEQVLGVQPVGVTDDFSYELSATSLDMSQVAAVIEETTGRRISPMTVASAATTERLAEELRILCTSECSANAYIN